VGFSASDIVQGYATLASSLLERWNGLAADASRKFDAGEYDCESAANDLATSASLATEGIALWAEEMLKAASAFAGPGPSIVTSEPFRAPAGATLELAGPLTKGPTLDELPVSVVHLQPSQLSATETEFTLCVDAAGHRGATYFGTVNALTKTGTAPVSVWITVP
jgi:hypothetical protein